MTSPTARPTYTPPASLAAGVVETFADRGAIPKRCMACGRPLLREPYGPEGELVNAGQRGALWVCPGCFRG